RQITIATTRDGAKYVGQPIGPLLRQTRLEQREQLLSGNTDDGMRAYAAIGGSQLSRWHLGVVAPSAEGDAIVGRSIGVVVAGALLFLLGIGVALIFARQVSRSIRELSSAAHALGRG